MSRVAGVFGNFWNLSQTPPGMCVLDGWELTTKVMRWAVRTNLCRAFWSRAVQLPYKTVIEPVTMLSMVHL
jgi:hypothetical protein